MKIKNSELQNLTIGLNALSKLKSKENVFKIAYNCARSLRIVSEALEDYDHARTAIIEVYAKRDDKNIVIKTQTEHGFNYSFDNEVVEKVNSELNALLNAEIELPILTLPLSEIESSKLEGITGEILFNLNGFITE